MPGVACFLLPYASDSCFSRGGCWRALCVVLFTRGRGRPGRVAGAESARPSGGSISNLWQYCHYFEIAGPVLGFFRTILFQKTGCDSHKFEIERPRRGGHHDHEHLRLSARRAFARLVGPPPAGRWRARAGPCGGAAAGRRGVCVIWQSVKADGGLCVQNREFSVRPCGFFVYPCGCTINPSHGFPFPSHGFLFPRDGFSDPRPVSDGKMAPICAI